MFGTDKVGVPTDGALPCGGWQTRACGAGAGAIPATTVEKPLQVALFVDTVIGLLYAELAIWVLVESNASTLSTNAPQLPTVGTAPFQTSLMLATEFELLIPIAKVAGATVRLLAVMVVVAVAW